MERRPLPRDNTLLEALGIEITLATAARVEARMPVDRRTHQPFGLLHGGASVVLAETLGSSAGNLCVDPARLMCVGVEINANHIRAVTEGVVTGTAKALHVGRSLHVWEIGIVDAQGRRVCASRLTLAVVPRPGAA